MQASDKDRMLCCFKDSDDLSKFFKKNVIRGTYKKIDDKTLLAEPRIADLARQYGAEVKKSSKSHKNKNKDEIEDGKQE
jgi:hypothetical protein